MGALALGQTATLSAGKRLDAYFPELGTRTQARATIGIFYTYLGQDGFGNFDWR